MNREFNFTNMYYYLYGYENEINPQWQYLSTDDGDSINRSSFIEISGEADDSVICTLAKFVEIMDNQGLEGFAVL